MNLMAILLTGLLAGGVSCAAVQGGLLTGLVARQHQASATARGTVSVKGRSTGDRAAGLTLPDAPSRGARNRLVDDLVPVGGFLAGKLVSHTILGAMLGGIGTAVELSAHSHALAQVAAGILIVLFGLAQLEVPGFKGFVIAPPASWLRLVRGRARSQAAFAPALLGFATVLIPCGVTLSVMALALTSGSWLNGAATMAVFVIGTSPLFTLIGYAALKAVTTWKDRLAVATGIVLLAMGLYTLNGGLTALGSPLAAKNLAVTLGFEQAPADASTVESAPDGTQTVVITVSSGYYSPSNALLKAGVPTQLIFRSEDARGCERALVIPAFDVEQILPENGDTVIDAGVLEPGTIEYSCSMGMVSGRLTVH
ncbi:sulfite exporter TauE/SafE family protein [Nocardioides speluncae]|uniref:sulfite exporter TauE/SafE family protein n=1 Tax=Nocardioides speluncae TaxID=2670337 RepID=UPI000D6963B4|nr:sulfite exporter TauE/SafE family protein [Nocardioides speluncae]